MSMTELKVSFPKEKLDALRYFLDKKQQSIEQELNDYLDKTYEKLVPAQVREYVESRMEQTPSQQQAPTQQQTLEQEPKHTPEQAPASKERPARPTRRQREQTATEQSSSQEVPSEAEGPVAEETQGMTMSM